MICARLKQAYKKHTYLLIEAEQLNQKLRQLHDANNNAKHSQAWTLINDITQKKSANKGKLIGETKKERIEPDILKASRKRRIATGSGRQVHEVNRLLKQFEQTKKLMKQAQKPGFANKLKNLLGGNQMPTIE